MIELTVASSYTHIYICRNNAIRLNRGGVGVVSVSINFQCNFIFYVNSNYVFIHSVSASLDVDTIYYKGRELWIWHYLRVVLIFYSLGAVKFICLKWTFPVSCVKLYECFFYYFFFREFIKFSFLFCYQLFDHNICIWLFIIMFMLWYIFSTSMCNTFC